MITPNMYTLSLHIRTYNVCMYHCIYIFVFIYKPCTAWYRATVETFKTQMEDLRSKVTFEKKARYYRHITCIPHRNIFMNNQSDNLSNHMYNPQTSGRGKKEAIAGN